MMMISTTNNFFVGTWNSTAASTIYGTEFADNIQLDDGCVYSFVNNCNQGYTVYANGGDDTVTSTSALR